MGRPHGSDQVTLNARTDYNACAGDQLQGWNLSGPESLEAAAEMTREASWADLEGTATGVCYLRSSLSLARIVDGTSKTYLIGEKYLNPDSYANGSDGADNESMYCGYNNDNHRTTHLNWAPMQDRAGLGDPFRFGSAHIAAFNIVFCDGSVRNIDYGIDPETHRRFGNREDQLPTP